MTTAEGSEPPSWQDVARALRDAAEMLVGCAGLGVELHDVHGRRLGTLTPALAVPLAKRLRLSAGAVESARRPALGMLVAADVELADLVMGTNLARWWAGGSST